MEVVAVKEWSEVLTFSCHAHCTTGGSEDDDHRNGRGGDDSGVFRTGDVARVREDRVRRTIHC